MRIQFQNIACCEWVHLLPSITFHIKGWREGIGIFRSLFPKDKKGFQVLIHWLWFEILIETEEKKIYFMENKINIAELLKDCPKGMELDCAMWDNCTFDGIEDVGYINILVKTPTGQIKLSKEGCFVHNCNSAKCVIFPKGKTTWEGFQRPFKDGDMVATNSATQMFILQRAKSNTKGYCYIGYDFKSNEFFDAGEWAFDRLATEKEKQKLFNAIKENGYRWDAATKTLEKLKTFKFAPNSIVRLKGTDIYYRVEEQKINRIKGFVEYKYKLRNIIDNSTEIVYDVDEDEYELVPNKFDINTLKPFDKVLVRNTNTEYWRISLFGAIVHDDRQYFMCLANSGFYQCIPYEHNEHLIGTPNDCDDFYKIWEK